MEIFWTEDVSDGLCRLGEEESAHCVRVLRHRNGDSVCIIDGHGTMYECELVSDSPKAAEAKIISTHPGWGSHGYNLTMAVCPTKNIDRFEWFIEKATEFGVDCICPVIGDHSERKVVKMERLKKILLSAAKQSLKSAIPQIQEPVSVNAFVRESAGVDSLKLIACCFDDLAPRRSIKEVLGSYSGTSVTILIGPEGDFSKEEVKAAMEAGYIPVQIGNSRLRTETAALGSVAIVYYNYM